MEDAVDALKIGFAVMMFVMALTISVSSLSQANSAVKSVITLNDREIEYNYVEPNPENTRIVGVEAIVPTMYKAYKENFQIYFYEDANKTKPLVIYYEVKSNGDRIGISCIDGSEVFGTAKEVEAHLNRILGDPNNVEEKYKKQLNEKYTDGFYKFLAGKTFKEEIGEYYQNDSGNTPEINKTKTRVITYTQVN